MHVIQPDDVSIQFVCPVTGSRVIVSGYKLTVGGWCENSVLANTHIIEVDCPSCMETHELRMY